MLPLRSPLSFAAGTREAVLGAWDDRDREVQRELEARRRRDLDHRQAGRVRAQLANGETVEAEHVVLAIGLQGNLRKLGVPGEDLPVVQYQLDDPEEYEDETIVVVGAGDAAIENALALAEQNRVIMINRNEEFSRCKEGNLTLVLAAIQDGKIECRYRAAAARSKRSKPTAVPARFNAKTPDGAEAIGCHRVIARLGATPPRKLVESFGIKFPNADPASVPQLSDTYESNVPGLYIIGALGGYPLIKQAMNQGYEVVEYIRGNRVDPADEPLLKAKFANYKRARTVSHGLILLQKNVPLLAGITTLQLREFLLDSEIRTPAPGEIIFSRNDYTDTFYSIVEGEVGIELERRHGRGALDRAARGRVLRRAGARLRAAARGDGQGGPRLRADRDAAALDAEADRVGGQRAPRDRRRVPEARGRAPPRAGPARRGSRRADRRARSSSRAPRARRLFTEGDAADGLYLIRRGSVTVSRRIGGRDVVLSYVAAGNYVGEMALLSRRAAHGARCGPSVATEAIVLDGARFKEIVARHPELARELEERFLDAHSRERADGVAGRRRATSSATCCSRASARRPTCC